MANDITYELGDQLSEKELCPEELLRLQEAAFARDIKRLLKKKELFVQVTCPACGEIDSKECFSKVGFYYNSCNSCDTIFMSPRPSEEIMADYYKNSENYAFWAEHIFPLSEKSRREKIHKPWVDRVVRYCDEYKINRKTLLEIGPGFGTFASAVIAKGSFQRVIAVEPTPELAQACRDRGIEVIEKRVEDLGCTITGVDVLVAFEVIEHLFNPLEFLVSIKKVMHKDGLLILSCPNGKGFDVSILKEKSLAVDAEHVNLFNPKSLETLLKKAGFKTLSLQTPGRLDSEFVREAALDGKVKLDPFLERILIDEWETHGWEFQKFIAAQGLSSHMWVVAQLNDR